MRVLLCFHVRLGPCDLPSPWQPSWQSHKGEELGSLHCFLEDCCPPIRNTHFDLVGKVKWYKATEPWEFVTKMCYHLNTSATSFLVLIMQDKIQRSQCLHPGFLWRLKLRKERNGSSQMIVFVEVGPSSLLMEPSLHERLGF